MISKFICLLVIHLCFAEEFNLKQLIPNNYDKNIVPTSILGSGPVKVKVGIEINEVINVHEASQVI